MVNLRMTARRWNRRVAMLAVVACAAGQVHADRVVLNSGRVLEGAIVKQTATEVVIRTEVGNVSLSRRDVRQIETTNMEPEEVDGDTAFARRDYDGAARNYATALEKVNRSAGNSEARARLEKKIADVRQAQLQQASAAVLQQLQSAQSMLAARRYDQAEKLVEATLPYLSEGDQITSTARRLLAEARFGLAEEAADRLDALAQERHLKKAIEADETFYKAHLAYGDILLRSSATEKLGLEEILRGLEYGEKLLDEAEVVKYHYLAGMRYYSQGDYAEAATHFIESLRGKGKYPAYADALDRAAKSYVRLSEVNKGGDFRSTIDTLNEALALDPRNKDARFLLGTIYLDQGEPDKAIPELEETVSIDPNYPRVHRNLARAYLAKRDYDTALKHLDLELKSEPNSYEVMVNRAAIYILLAEYDKARDDLAKAVAIEPSRWNAYLKAAELASAQERYDDARANLTRVLSLKPDAVEAYVQMGNILVKQKNYNDARKWYNEVIQYLERLGNLSHEYRKLMAEALTQLGVIDFEQESPRQAETRFVMALQYMPDYAHALNKVGDVKRRLGEEVKARESKEAAAPFFAEAEQFYRRAIEADPTDADLYLSLGILYHQSMKEAAKALPNYMAYLDKGGRNAEVVKWVDEVGGSSAEAAALLAKNAPLAPAGTEQAAAAPLAPAAALAVDTDTTATVADAAQTTATEGATTATEGAPAGVAEVLPLPADAATSVPAETGAAEPGAEASAPAA